MAPAAPARRRTDEVVPRHSKVLSPRFLFWAYGHNVGDVRVEDQETCVPSMLLGAKWEASAVVAAGGFRSVGPAAEHAMQEDPCQ